ncbi:MAG: hypothetical protein IRY95_06245 [Clostridia bacterium]|nr:hypothetical protein [Clostridia bacterium]
MLARSPLADPTSPEQRAWRQALAGVWDQWVAGLEARGLPAGQVVARVRERTR